MHVFRYSFDDDRKYTLEVLGIFTENLISKKMRDYNNGLGL